MAPIRFIWSLPLGSDCKESMRRTLSPDLTRAVFHLALLHKGWNLGRRVYRPTSRVVTILSLIAR
jgi:hypothetical protein